MAFRTCSQRSFRSSNPLFIETLRSSKPLGAASKSSCNGLGSFGYQASIVGREIGFPWGKRSFYTSEINGATGRDVERNLPTNSVNRRSSIVLTYSRRYILLRPARQPSSCCMWSYATPCWTFFTRTMGRHWGAGSPPAPSFGVVLHAHERPALTIFVGGHEGSCHLSEDNNAGNAGYYLECIGPAFRQVTDTLHFAH